MGRLWPAAKLTAVTALRLHIRPLTWIAFVAILALSLLPTLSHALAYTQAQGAGGWAEVCTPQGPKRVAVDAEGKLAQTVVDPTADAAGIGVAHLTHCPLCALALDVPLLPPAAPLALAGPIGRCAPPAAFLHAPRTLHAWRSAQPRGPPAVS